MKLGFSDDELFRIIRGEQINNQEKQKRFLQLWLNQTTVVFRAREVGMVGDDDWFGTRKDIVDLFQLESMRTHWNQVKGYYSPNLCEFVKEVMREKATK